MNQNQQNFIACYNQSIYLQSVINHFIYWANIKSLAVHVKGCAITTLNDKLDSFGITYESELLEDTSGIFVTIK